ncbi:hypothetical protein Ocin01_04535 [Orchesella cincta]|uniref:Kindlin-2 N-terminal domain-containing protein n=1 Tax=Orchesella cincta TaxID=48709 RepID=A0A1D2NA79_ORCCI|nr:hypothetical protein Ocin01_04535 [Orchesella cincta]
MFADGNLVGDGSWELRILVTDLNEEPRTLRVKGDLHIGGLMLQLVEDLGKKSKSSYMHECNNKHAPQISFAYTEKTMCGWHLL